MSFLAALAMALLFAAPNVSRLLAAASEGAHATWSQMCTAGGLKLVEIGDQSAAAANGALPAAPVGQHADGDCPYCPLAAGIAVLLLCLSLGLPGAPHRGTWRWRWRRDRARAFLHPTGLGAQGPPRAA